MFLSGCSTMMNSGTQSMTVVPSEGEDVEARVTTPSGSYQAKLPTTVTASPSHQGVKVQITDSRYQNSTMSVGKSVDGFFFANLIWFTAFPAGMAVDAATGKMWDYNNQTVVPLQAKGTASSDK